MGSLRYTRLTGASITLRFKTCGQDDEVYLLLSGSGDLVQFSFTQDQSIDYFVKRDKSKDVIHMNENQSEIPASNNPILDKLPNHLRQFIKTQDYEAYTAIDHAVWRYVMRQNVQHLAGMAHDSYLDGLKKTGISLDCIPNMDTMNQILANIGWAAVCVDGFIPPSAFMEFQAYNVLVIAADIRQLEHIEYTPAPDIIHEGAGHAPIIANPEYAEYLRRFGEIGCKAISSEKDFQLYEAVRHLSIIKEAPDSSAEEIADAEAVLEGLQNDMGEPSEMARIRNLHWWTVEYGLIGEMNDLKIYGAGLLSSIGESSQCLTDQVLKLPYTVDAADQNFDITRPQPQLFVTPDFAHLSLVLEEFANKMALRRGGLSGVQKLIDSPDLGTIELSTGLQISGHFSRVISNEEEPCYVQTQGPTALSLRDKELVGHGTGYHSEGFGSPIGKLKGINLAIEDMSPRDLMAYNIYEGKAASLEFDGGITVKGTVLTGKRNLQGKIVLVSFSDCTVKYGDEFLFRPEWGIYDMAVGKSVSSAYNGPADHSSFDLATQIPGKQTYSRAKSGQQKELEKLYQRVRDFRDDPVNQLELEQIFIQLKKEDYKDWLLALEIYELAKNKALQMAIRDYLEQVANTDQKLNHLIQNGLELGENTNT